LNTGGLYKFRDLRLISGYTCKMIQNRAIVIMEL